MKEPNEWNQRMFPWLYPYETNELPESLGSAGKNGR